jgi:hypothetical protein
MCSRSKRFKDCDESVVRELLDNIDDDFSSFSKVNDYIDKKVTTLCKKYDVYTCVDCFMKNHRKKD